MLVMDIEFEWIDINFCLISDGNLEFNYFVGIVCCKLFIMVSSIGYVVKFKNFCGIVLY